MVDPISTGFMHSATADGAAPSRLGLAIVGTDIPTIIDIFKNWNLNRPPVADTVRDVIQTLSSHLGVKFTDTERGLITAAATLADEENTNLYHNNKHFLEVFTLSAVLGADAFKDGRLSQHHFCLLMSAALIHDYKHDGTNNMGQRYRLENIALSESESALKAAGATEDDWNLLKAFIRTTDVSKDFSIPSSLSPAESVKIYSLTKNPDDLMDELRILADTGTADISLMLEDSDLSCGMMDADLFDKSNHAIAREQGRVTTRPSTIFFLDKICHGQLFSVSGKRLMQPYMDKTLQSYGLQPTPSPASPFPECKLA